jgi:hypothetical protein
MGAFQREISLCVREGLFGDGRDVFASSLMFGMALATHAGFVEAAMEAALAFDILAYFFVAVLTEAGLRGLVESFVALRAVLFPFCMPPDHLAWHQCRLDVLGSGKCRREYSNA